MISVVAICQHAKILHNYWIYYPPCRESWEQKNWCLWTVVLEKSLESPLDCEEIQPVHLKGDQSWVFIGRTNEAEASILWHLMQRTDSFEKTLMLGKEEKGPTGDEMVGWHHRHNGHGFGWVPLVGDGQGGKACCGSWCHRVRHDWATENWPTLYISYLWLIYFAVEVCTSYLYHLFLPHLWQSLVCSL